VFRWRVIFGLFFLGVGVEGWEYVMREEIQYFIVSIPLYKYNIGVQENFITLNGTDIFQ
jgi:hypothetical protein